MRLVESLAILSWFAGGVLLGLIEIITLPTDPNASTVLQLLPLLLLVGGIWYVVSRFRHVSESSGASRLLRRVMIVGWAALFGVDAGIASINNMSTEILHTSIPYYFQGVSLSQKVIALTGIFVLGIAAVLASRSRYESTTLNEASGKSRVNIWEKPLTTIGFMVLLLGIVLGLAQYWPSVVFAGFILLLAGAMLYPIGRLTEKDIETG